MVVYCEQSDSTSSCMDHTQHWVNEMTWLRVNTRRPRVGILPGEAGGGPAGAHHITVDICCHHLLDGELCLPWGMPPD
jgi:hypothetical protein